jgi:PAS domain-containing protein
VDISAAALSVGDTTTVGSVETTMPDLFRLAMRQSAVATCLVGLDGRFLALNPATCELLGRPESVLMALTLQELTVPADLDAHLALVDQVVTGTIDSYRLLLATCAPVAPSSTVISMPGASGTMTVSSSPSSPWSWTSPNQRSRVRKPVTPGSCCAA